MTIAYDCDLSQFGTGPVSTDLYCSDGHFDLEREHIFRRVWLYAGHEFDAPNPGDYFVKELAFLDASILIVRGKDGQLRAFHNVCAHRHARVVWEPKGNARHFTCKYHGWGYDLGGRLRSVPDQENFYGLDRDSCGLTPVAVDSSNGMIFINLAREPEQTLKDFLGEVGQRLARFPLAQWSTCFRFTAELPVNWKCIVDNFQETYHVFSAHAVSVNTRSVGPENPMGYPLKFEFFDLHRGMDIWANPNHRPSPVESIVNRSGGIVGQTGGAENETAAMYVFGIFPNVVLNVTPYFLQLHEALPIAVDRTRWSTTAFFPRAESAGQRIAQEYSAALLRDISAEDVGILASLQQGMRSGAKTEIHFQATEVLCRHLAVQVEQYIARGQEGRGVREGFPHVQ